MYRRMPVVASIKGGRQFPGRCLIRVTIHGVTNVVWILLMYAGQGKIGKPLSRVDIELNRALGSRTHSEEKDSGADDQFHRS